MEVMEVFTVPHVFLASPHRIMRSLHKVQVSPCGLPSWQLGRDACTKGTRSLSQVCAESKHFLLGGSELLGQLLAISKLGLAWTPRTEIQSAQTLLIRIRKKSAPSRIELSTTQVLSEVIVSA